jgi:hypothetical protein
MSDLDLDQELRRRFQATVSLAHHDRSLLEAGQKHAASHSRHRLRGKVLEHLRKLAGAPRVGRNDTLNRPRLFPGLRNLAALWLVVLLAGAGALIYTQLPGRFTGTSPQSHSRTSKQQTIPLPPTTTTTVPRPTTDTTLPGSRSTAFEAKDKSYVATKLDDCYPFTPDHRCGPWELQVAYASDGSTGTLYAVTALQTTGDSCYRSSVWFFDNATPIPLSSDLLPPDVVATTDPDGVDPEAPDLSNTVSFVDGTAAAAGRAEFAIPYAVSLPVMPGSMVSCADVGHAGTDTYVYRWNGRTMTYVSGEPPTPPLVIGLGPSTG